MRDRFHVYAGDNVETFGERLSRLVRKSGLERTVIARHAGISPAYLYSLMKDGVQKPSLPVMEGLARALEVTPDYIRFGREQDEPRIDSVAQLKGWLTGTLFQHMEDVIEAEVRRRMSERVPVVRVDEATFRRIARASHGQIAAGTPKPIMVEPADEEYWHDERNFPQSAAS